MLVIEARVASGLPSLGEMENAARLIYESMPATAQYSWPQINRWAGSEVWVKHENHTPVGAFKVRGGLVYMDWLRRERPEVETVVSATRGNHGQSIAYAARRTGHKAVIVVPHGNSAEKNAAMRELGAELIEFGEDFQAANEHGAALAVDKGWHRVPSFDMGLVRGIATYALEFFRGAPEMERVYVPIGMGSGVCGMIAARDALGLRTRIVGVVSSAAPAMARSFEAGRVSEAEAKTRIADGVACRLPDATALEMVLGGVERVVEVDDDEVEDAMRLYFTATHNAAEGAGAIGLAALLKDRSRGVGRVGTVLSGGNVDSDVFRRVLLSKGQGDV